jgi:hypothetical protein
MKTYTRESKFTELKPYCHLSKPDAFMEVTEWWNGEGFDVTMNDKTFSMTHGEFQALQALVHYQE